MIAGNPGRPMLPSLVFSLPKGNAWHYEVKYDGYRTALHFTNDGIDLISRNLHSFNACFPDIIRSLRPLRARLRSLLPIVLDGELCILASDHRADFEIMQTRGRLKDERKISMWAEAHPADFLAFDLLEWAGENFRNQPYSARKRQLRKLFLTLDLPLRVDLQSGVPFHYVPCHSDGEHLWDSVKTWNSEGMVAKKADSPWIPGKRTESWLKIKNWKTATFFLTAYDKENGYFHVAVLREGTPYEMGVFSHGLQGNERSALVEIIQKNRVSETADFIAIQPSICVELQFIDLYKEGLRQVRFQQFRFDKHWEDCTWEAVLKSIPNSISTERK